MYSGDQMKIKLDLCKYVFRDENIEYIGLIPISDCSIINQSLFDRSCSWAKSVILFLVPYYTGDKENRNILHLLFAHTTVRGSGTEVIEDTVPLFNVKCSVKYQSQPSKISTVPDGSELEFTYSDGYAEFTVPKVDIHQMIEMH